MIEFTVPRYNEADADTVKKTVSAGRSTSPWQEGASFKLTTSNPFGLATTRNGNSYPVVYLVDRDGNEVPLWLSTLVKGVLNESKVEVFSTFEFNIAYRHQVCGHNDPQTWWKAFAELVGECKIIAHREPVWVGDRRYILIGFELVKDEPKPKGKSK